MFLSHSISPLSLSEILLIMVCLRDLVQPVKGASNSTTLNHALGINCRGSGLCPTQDLAFDYIGIMLSIVNDRPDCHRFTNFDCGPLNNADVYKPNANIVCLPQGKSFLGGICAFTPSHPPPELGFADSSEIRSGSSSKGTTDSKTRAEGNVDTYGTFGAEIKRKLKQLSDHGCHSCGSVPLSDGNDPAEAGILTVNYISSVACPGLCPPTHYYADALVEAY